MPEHRIRLLPLLGETLGSQLLFGRKIAAARLDAETLMFLRQLHF